MNVGVVLLDAAAEAEFANPAACRLLECAVDGVRGRWSELKRLVRLDPQRILGSPGALRLVADVPARQGVRSLRLEIRPRDDTGRTGYLVLLRDRRVIDALEESLLLASQMRSLVHGYRALAHDLRSPLNSMQLTLDLLADPGADDPRGLAAQEHYVAVLREALARLNTGLKSVLDGCEPLRSLPREFDLRDVLNELVRLLAPQARRQRVGVETRLSERPALMSGCRDHIRQALLNLTLHGLEAMPAGGHLAIDLALQGGSAGISVRYGGGGDVDGVLDEVYRVLPGPDMSPGALGLYLARVVVESHGGEFAARVDPVESMRFDLTLPLAEQPAGTHGIQIAASRRY